METKQRLFELSIARQVRWCIVFVDLKLPLLIAGPINPGKYFPVACVISQISFNFVFQYTCLCEKCGFLLRWSHICYITHQTLKFYFQTKILLYLLTRSHKYCISCVIYALFIQHYIYNTLSMQSFGFQHHFLFKVLILHHVALCIALLFTIVLKYQGPLPDINARA